MVLLFAAGYLIKEEYGQLEFYKKVIEVGSSVLAFGFPALILSYTRSLKSKVNFLALSTSTVVVLAIAALPFLFFVQWEFLIVPFLFYALFFNGGIMQSYLLVKKGSNYVSYYKIIVSIFFYCIVFLYIYFEHQGSMAYVYVNYALLPILIVYTALELYKEKLVKSTLKKYWTLFRKLLLSSFTLVVSNFANLMFLYTDIFVIKWVSQQANSEIADFSFALNIASILLIAPLTLVQVNIEKLKINKTFIYELHKNIKKVVLPGALVLVGVYYVLVSFLFVKYETTFVLFTIILFAKVFHALSSLFGTNLLIYKKFKENLIINIVMLLLNVILCWVGYNIYGIIGLAGSSAACLALRYFVLFFYNKQIVANT
ncbi:hypothetical protein KXJ69_03975 [Aureisphaera sp. CAU 1614]|uniref:Uncharacterized protein n=1 Tax=Halomarinibacterium sedimenti TaxID=2857106 RepID=A0A9X1JUU7_9FLAO|nr:hypothetical protein [Halomarinibacterium sedimenti]MBW2937249.1 hypothetical protein [Halomarinibacterium sedimenti]